MARVRVLRGDRDPYRPLEGRAQKAVRLLQVSGDYFRERPAPLNLGGTRRLFVATRLEDKVDEVTV